MQAQAEHVGADVVYDYVLKVELDQRPFKLICDSGDTYLADALIVATGAQARWLDLPSEQKFRGYGVSACATCDGFFYRDKDVIVVGGGNTAVEEALFLTNFASRVTVVHLLFESSSQLPDLTISHTSRRNPDFVEAESHEHTTEKDLVWVRQSHKVIVWSWEAHYR